MWNKKTSNLKKTLVYISTAISKLHGNCQPKIYKRYTHKKEKGESKHNPKVNHQIIKIQNRKGKKKTCRNKTRTVNKMAITQILIIYLNANVLNAPTKKHWVTEWIQKQNPYTNCLQETHFKSRNTYRLKVKGWKKVFHAIENQKKSVGYSYQTK